MAGVTIDIPGIGNVEAKNAATEATLREILKAIQGVQKNTSGKGVGPGGSGGGGPSDGGADGTEEKKEQEKRIGLGDRLGRGMGILTGKIKDLTTESVNLIDDLANVGDSLTSAASTMKNIPVAGTFLAGIFGSVAQAAESTVGAFQQATASGATFGGSINQFAKSASAAGMVMADFANLISQNGEAMRLLGGTTEGGAQRFAQLSKTMRQSPFMSELNNLGYSTKDVNEGMAGYIKYLGQTGKIGGKSNTELAAGSAKYLKQMDLLAKITGETRKDQEAARQKLLTDAQFQSKVANMGSDAGEAFANTINGLPAGLRNVAKDIMVTGTATTEESQKFAAMMPQSAALMQKYAQITENGGTITAAMQQELQNTLAAEGKNAKQQYRTIGMYSAEAAGTINQIVQASNIQTDAIKKGTDAQNKAKKTTDGQAAALAAAKRNLAEFSNSFQMALANSGLLTTLMQAFQGLATFVQNIVVPAFQFMAPIIGQIVSTVVSLLIPAFQFVGSIVQQYIMPLLPPAIQMLSDAFSFIGGLIKDYVVPTFFTIADFIQDNFVPILAAAVTGLIAYGGWLAASKIPIALETAARYASIPALMAQAAATWAVVAPILAIAAPFIAIAAAAAGVAYYFKKMGGDLQVLGDMFGWVGDTFKQVFLKIKEGFFTLLNKIPGMRGDFDEDLKEIAKEQEEMDKKKEQREQRISDTMKANRERAAAEEKQKEAQRNQRDNKFANMKFGAEMKGIGAKTAAEKKAIEEKKEAEKPTSINYSGPDETLKSFFKQQNADVYREAEKKKATEAKEKAFAKVKEAKTPEEAKAAMAEVEAQQKNIDKFSKKAAPESKKEASTAKAEATKKSIEADAEAKKAETQKKESNQKDQEKAKETMPEPAQESAESLLAQLNNNMSELLRITKAGNRVAQKQLNVQESLSGDIFANPAA
jgi:hypothetical protein